MKHFRGARCTLLVLVVVMLAREAQAAQTIDLGGTYGWTSSPNVDYDKFISNYKVKIGDTIRFVNYDSGYHTLINVDKAGYDSCGESGEKFVSEIIQPGNGREYTYTGAGDDYYICDLPLHCVKGQKVHIQVLNADGSTKNTTASETPNSSGASQLPGLSWTSQLMVVVVATFSLMVVGATM